MQSYWQRLIGALLNQPAPVPAAPPISAPEPRPAAPAADPALQSRIATLELDLADRDGRIETMKKEYENLERERQAALARGGDEQIEKLYKKLAANLSNASVLVAASESGQAVEAEDWVGLFKSLERELQRAGLERVGAPGERVAFSVANHQRMSGGGVAEGETVVIRVPGYRTSARVLLKAMVSSPEGGHE